MSLSDIAIATKCSICIGELETGGSLAASPAFAAEIRHVYLHFGAKCSKNGGNMLTHSQRLTRSKNAQLHGAISILRELISFIWYVVTGRVTATFLLPAPHPSKPEAARQKHYVLRPRSPNQLATDLSVSSSLPNIRNFPNLYLSLH